jgi:post-segregation antitoxin (ccd killing protein)
VIEMGEKRMTSMKIDGEVLDKAKELGLNISQFCENSLKRAIKALESLERNKNGE